MKVGGLKGKLGESIKVLTDSKNNKVKNIYKFKLIIN